MKRAILSLACLGATAAILSACDDPHLSTPEQKANFYSGKAVQIASDGDLKVFAMQVPDPTSNGHQTIYVVKGGTVTFEERAGKHTFPVTAAAP